MDDLLQDLKEAERRLYLNQSVYDDGMLLLIQRTIDALTPIVEGTKREEPQYNVPPDPADLD